MQQLRIIASCICTHMHTLTVFFSFCGGFPREGRRGISSCLGVWSRTLNQRFFSYFSLMKSITAWSSFASGILSVLSFHRANHFALATWKQTNQKQRESFKLYYFWPTDSTITYVHTQSVPLLTDITIHNRTSLYIYYYIRIYSTHVYIVYKMYTKRVYIAGKR